MLRRIYIEGRPHIAPDGVSRRDIRRLAVVDKNLFLTLQNPEGEGYKIFDEKKNNVSLEPYFSKINNYIPKVIDCRMRELENNAEFLSASLCCPSRKKNEFDFIKEYKISFDKTFSDISKEILGKNLKK